MSANLLEDIAPTLISGTTESDGIWHCPAKDGKHDSLAWNFSGMSALSANQTLHLGISAKGASADASDLHMVVAYKDSAGNRNWAWSDAMPVGTEWSRAGGTVVIPSGMTIYALTVSTSVSSKLPEVWLTAPCLSYGSPVCLASSAHTPYATQDHVSVTYATKASLKVTDDSVKAEVKARAKTDGAVSELSSILEQTANGINISLDRLSDTDKKVNSWFGFGSDPSGNPQLTMGSSTSPVVGVYTNTGLAYRSRSGATLLELDGASRSSTMPHVHADDVSIGSWQWVPTQNGMHFTLMWIGG